MVSGLRAMTCPQRCAELKLDTLEKRRIYQDMSLVYKLATGSIFISTSVLKMVGICEGDKYCV
jgi:hypothetical protein